MKSLNDYKAFTDKEAQNYLAQALPDGKLTANRFDSDSYMYKLILCMSEVIKIITGQLYTLAKNWNIQKAEELLPEWEESVSIGTKYPVLDTIEKRRDAVERKISKIPVYNIRPATDDDTTIENYVKKLTDIDIVIQSAGELESTSAFPCSFPIQFGTPYQQRQLLLIVKIDYGSDVLANNQFPMPFPVRFFDTEIPDATKSLLDIVLDDVVPSFMNWEYEILT